MRVRDWMTPFPETVDRFAPLREWQSIDSL